MEHYAGSQKNSRKSDQHFRFLKSLGQNFLQDEEVIVEFNNPVRAITKGQAVVLYDGDYVIGGGTIV